MAVDRTLTIPEAAAIAGVSESSIRARIQRGSLPSVRVGGRRRVPIDALYEQGLIALRPGATVSELLDRIEALARRVGELEERLRAESG